MSRSYVVATVRPWNIKAYHDVISTLPGRWHLVTERAELTTALLDTVRPRYVFLPHWNHIIEPAIFERVECVSFHESDVPFGRGGSPIQNLIARGVRQTSIAAMLVDRGIDTGPVYLRRPLSLEGVAEEIFVRASAIVADMIREIAATEPTPVPQDGEGTFFKRRTPDQSEVPADVETLADLFDHIRMLDADGYPRAFLRYHNVVLELSRPALRTDFIEADVRIRLARKDPAS